jgi:ABC-type multidrug transport system ATPase subunit
MAQRGEQTIIISSHNMSVAQDICARVIIINNGKITTDDRFISLFKLLQTSDWWSILSLDLIFFFSYSFVTHHFLGSP